jgi:chromosome segregation ATPase
MNRKRVAASMASASASSANKRFKRSSADIREDAEALERRLQRNTGILASTASLTPMLQENHNPETDSIDQLRAELSNLRRQQAVDRAHLKNELNDCNARVEDLRRALDNLCQGQSPSEDVAGEGGSDESTVKSEYETMASNLYDA